MRATRLASACALAGALAGCATLAEPDAVGSGETGGALAEPPLAPPGPSRFQRVKAALSPFPAPKVYEIAFEGLDEERDADLLTVLRGASQTVADQRGRSPAEIALRRRARGDEERLTRALRSEGYFKGRVRARLVAAADADEKPTVRFQVTPGPRFAIRRFEIIETVPTGSRPLPTVDQPETGGPARSADILAAEAARLDALRAAGRPYAKLLGRDARADLEANTLSIISRIDAGPFVTVGALEIDGADRVEPDFVAGFFETIRDKPVSRPAIARIESQLAGTRLFRAARVTLPETPPERDGPAPLKVALVEAPRRTVGGGVRYNTEDGPGGRVFWEHRNLLGRAERFRAELTVALDQQELETSFRKPRFRRPDQTLALETRVGREENEAFESLSAEGNFGLERAFSRRWSGAAAIGFEIASIDEDPDDDASDAELSYLVGLPLALRYDGSDDPLDPTRGQRAQFIVAPWTGVSDGDPLTFTSLQISGSAYQRLDAEARYVLAGRARAQSILGAGLFAVPANRRAFAGGGGSVRGFGARLIGPLDDEEEPTGGLAAYDASLELRVRITDTIGVVPFFEAGTVEERAFDFRLEDVVYGAGLGLRYRSPIGPLRFDAAFPLNRRDVDDPVQIYASIGQAF